MRFREFLLDLFFPRMCYMCGERLTDNEQILCSKCIEELPRTWQATNRQNMVESVFTEVDGFVRGGAFCFFEKGSDYRRLIHQVKYSHHPEVAAYVGELAAREWMQLKPNFFEGIDLLIPVPLHEKKLRLRGYNQSEYICKGLSAATGIEVDTTHLRKTKNNTSQTAKSAVERMLNTEHAYEVRNPEELNGKHILLVDDIITTGATITACMEALTKGADVRCSVFALGVAKGI